MNPRAAIYMLFSSMAFAVMYLLAKQLSHYGGFELTFFRALGTWLIAIVYLLSKGISPLGNRPWWLLARGLTGGSSLLLFFFAIEHVPITAAVAIRYLSPLFAIVFAILFLKERVRPLQWLFFLVAFIGVVLLKGFDSRIGGIGLVLILLSALLAGMTFAIIRYLGKTEHPLVIVGYFTGTGMILGLLGMLLTEGAYTQPAAGDWWPLIAIGLVGFVGQIFMTVAMQIEVASKVMPLKYLEAVFLLGLSFVFLDESYGVYALLGMVLILGGNVLNVFTKK
ncbi:MAG: DMT family transporter [Saprospiraceae bacterium]